MDGGTQDADLATAQPLRHDGRSAASSRRVFVFVRFWPGFAGNFCYEQFGALPEDVIDDALRSSLKDELRRRWNEVKEKHHAEKQWRREKREWLQRQSVAPVSFSSYREARRPKPKSRPPRSARQSAQFTKLASLVGWHTGTGAVDFVVSPRVWLVEVESPDIALDLFAELAELRLATDVELKRNIQLNPRFGYIFENDLHAREKASALVDIENLRGDKPIAVLGEVARLLLPRVDKFLSHVRSIGKSSAADSNADQVEAEPAIEAPIGSHSGTNNGDPILVFHVTSQAAFVEFEHIKHPVNHNIAEAFQKMYDAKGRPVGIGPILGEKPARALKKVAPELRSIVTQDGNKGYRLTIFDEVPDVGH